ncbi:thioesterase family protein [Alcanivorax sp. DP30]|uniref:thioesterase family protein n=1 Tax=Alcanivorax sp. DP30 TaxID=2606217 RepID=UPI00136D23C7|nr:thioesterase family protein [Alcanivorax sp. DP30]MZR61982.1 thioesterase family protein [Alcanivorax sp. DP30]
MTFDEILSTVDGKGNGLLPEGWGQGRALFGGLVGAVLFDHLQKSVAPGRVLRSFSLSFVAPAVPGPVSLTSEVFREGKSVMQAMVTARQEGQVVAAMLASMGAARESSVTVPAPNMPGMKAPQDSLVLPTIKGVTPDFLEFFDLRYAEGKPPYCGSDDANFTGYMGFREPPSTMSTAALIALVDTWPPSVLSMLKTPAPASSLTWTMELLNDPASRPADTLWRYQVHTDQCSDGYGQSQATIWDAEGKAVALSRQTFTVFA